MPKVLLLLSDSVMISTQILLAATEGPAKHIPILWASQWSLKSLGGGVLKPSTIYSGILPGSADSGWVPHWVNPLPSPLAGLAQSPGLHTFSEWRKCLQKSLYILRVVFSG